ncbi:MAG: hypothetical protein O3A87_06170 [Verrucomicrobia bacterium]|nr:hypothetical protein [Verrucomicrobiota bacterium]MDA1006052.1 hypothetical protein [Verrucomicrobiota bacterium]
MKGFLDHRIVKATICYVCMVCLVASMLASILSIWEVLGDAALHKWLSTLAVVFFGSLFFLGLNLVFGSMTQSVYPPESAGSPFGDRMKRAKEFRARL